MIVELLQADAVALCELGNTDYINEFKAILAEKVTKWGKDWTRTTTSPSSIIQAVNYLKMRDIPTDLRYKAELEDFISNMPC